MTGMKRAALSCCCSYSCVVIATFPADSGGASFAPFKAAAINLRANNQHEIGFPDLALHPTHPICRSQFVLVNVAIKAPLAQRIRQLQHTGDVLLRIVAVADENFGWILRIRQGAQYKTLFAADKDFRNGEETVTCF